MLRSSFSSTVAGWSPAYVAALALVAIQVGIGIVYKIAQKGGRSVLPSDSGPGDRGNGLLTSAQLHILDLILHHPVRIPQMYPVDLPLLPGMPEAACCQGLCIPCGGGLARAIVAG